MTHLIQPTPLQDYQFDLHGFLTIPGCASAAQLADMNLRVDGWIADGGEWIGGVHKADPDPYGSEGDARKIIFRNGIEDGGAFEEMIDNPAWLGFVRRYVDPCLGLHLWHNQVAIGRPGSYTRMHAGGHLRVMSSNYHYHDGVWHCGNVAVIMALQDIGPGDGATVVIPGSHTTNLPNPRTVENLNRPPPLGDEGGNLYREVHLRAGDALLFTDAIEHGSALRTNSGNRRVILFSYTPAFARDHAYEPSDELIARLTPERRKLVQPVAPIRRPRPVPGAGSGQLAGSR